MASPGKDLLLEIGTEPLPARFIAPAMEQLRANLLALLRERHVGFDAAEVKAFGTLRRLSILVEGVADRSDPPAREVKGPPARLWKDEAGRYTPQAEGFARRQGLSPDKLQASGEFLLARVQPPAEPALAILARELPRLLEGFDFPKTMVWEEGERFSFGRPLRHLTALLGTRVIAFQKAGVKSGRLVPPHPALARKPVALAEPRRYQKTLRDLLVVADPAERREILVKRLEVEARKLGGQLDLDEALVAETVFMTEHPVPVPGRFRPEFLALPAPLLSLVMKKQLKFFPLSREGRLLPVFLGVRDGVSEGQKLVAEGYERVLAARLSDAVFFHKRDLASRLEAKLPLLERVTYQQGLGSMAAKAGRVRQLAAWLCESVRQDYPVQEEAVLEIARLCYADLVTEVVREFPELQGGMGGSYARHDGLEERVALGLEQFYYPLGPRSPAPATAEGALASLAGKLDTLAGCFTLGLVPTGSADPYALRRQALGALRVLLEKHLPVDLEKALEAALSLQPVALDPAKQTEILKSLAEFVWGRAQSFFEELGHRVDEIRAVRAGGLQNLPRTLLRLSAVRNVRRLPDFEPLAAAFKRASNILKQARVPVDNGNPCDRALFKEEAELSLYDALTGLEGAVREKVEQQGFEEGLRALVAIKPQLDRFFEKVMVMAEDQGLRRQRLALLSRLVRLFRTVADLSEIQAAA